MKKSALVLALAGVAAAQSSGVIGVFYPGAEGQTLLGSIISSDATKTTLAVACPTNAGSDNDCAMADVTVTVGPSTFHAEESFESTSVILDCQVTGTTAATCSETYVGPVGLLETDVSFLTAVSATFDTSITTTATTTTLAASEIIFIPVTLTTGLGDSSDNTAAASGSSGSAPTAASGSSGSAPTAQSTGSGGGSGTSSSGSSTTTSSTAVSTDQSSGSAPNKGDSWMLACAAAGTGLMGMLILFL